MAGMRTRTADLVLLGNSLLNRRCSCGNWTASSSVLSHFHIRSISSPGRAVDDGKPSLEKAEDEFRVYEIPGMKEKQQRRTIRYKRKEVPPPRWMKMKPEQDWTHVWPAAASFKGSVVPLPIRQGFVENSQENEGVTPGRYANAELMKIPNFLHLTPGHIKKHCQAIKEFCTDWPVGLETDKKCEEHFPLEVVTSDYLAASPSIRNPKARGVSFRIKLSRLELDYHARDKLLRLVGDRYDKDTDEITLHTDRCPMKKQNYDFNMYLLTALFFESWKKEAWEEEKTEADMERYFWDISQSKKTLLDLLQRIQHIDTQQVDDEARRPLPYLRENISPETIADLEPVQEYKEAISDLFNEGENVTTLNNYKASVLKLLNIPPPTV